MESKQLWQQTLSQLETTLSKPIFQTWFKDKTTLFNFTEGVIEIGCVNSYARGWLEERYSGLIKQIMEKLTEKPTEVRFVVDRALEKVKAKEKPLEAPLFEFEQELPDTLEKKIFHSNLNPKYTFENFVIGNNNRLAHAVAINVSKSPAKSYNPFFLYGGVGVGKTHLMQAIGHEIVRTHEELKVLYCTGESFTNEMIEAIQNRTTGRFRTKYRGIDILLIDDIQFIAGRDTTQEEFFHTFNALHSGGKQIALTSDRPPKDIAKLEDRLSSRFGWGMIADIQTPDTDMREAILLSKCKQKNIILPPDILHYLAENVTESIRDLEGSLTRLTTTSTLLDRPLGLELAKQVLSPSTKPNLKKKVTAPKEIIEIVCDYFSVKASDIKGATRSADIVRPRQVIMFLLRTDLKLQFVVIAKLLGGRDHTTIMYGVDKIKKTVENDGNLSGQIGEIRALIQT